MTKHDTVGKRKAQEIEQGRSLPAPCPDCGSYDVDVERDNAGQPVNVCNACSWADR